MSVSLNTIDVARSAFLGAWQKLLPRLDEARRRRSEATQNLSILSDPAVLAEVRWLETFEKELAQVQQVKIAADAGSRLPPTDFDTAKDAAVKLLEILDGGIEAASAGHPAFQQAPEPADR